MARPLVLTALALGAAAATSAGAQPSPYASGDRYGPAPTTPGAPAAYGEAVAASAPRPALRGRVLAWPGKVEVAAPVMRAATAPTASGAVQPSRTSASAPVAGWSGPARYAAAPAQTWRPATQLTPVGAYASPAQQAPSGPRAMAAALAGAPADGWRPVFAGQGAATAGPPPAPAAPAPAARADYAPAVAAARAAPPNRVFAADRRYGYDPTQDHSVRFYSVARPFGLKPDPAPIPPQFFTATADLGGDPPGPLPINHTTPATRAAVVGGSDTGGQ